MSVVLPEINTKINTKIAHNLKEQILSDSLWENLEALDFFLTPFVKFIRLFESDMPLLSYVYSE